MTKIFWLNIAWNNSFSKVKSSIRDLPYRKKSDSGFLLEQLRENYLTGRFVEKKVVNSQLVDPFNEIQDYQITKYEYVDFKISNQVVGIEVVNPPRTIRNFLNELSKYSEYSIAIAPCNPDILVWYNELKSQFKEIELTGLICDHVRISDRVTGKIFLNGNDEIIDIISNYNDIKVKQLSFFFRHEHFGSGNCVLSINGYCKIDSSTDFHHVSEIINKKLIEIT